MFTLLDGNKISKELIIETIRESIEQFNEIRKRKINFSPDMALIDGNENLDETDFNTICILVEHMLFKKYLATVILDYYGDDYRDFSTVQEMADYILKQI
jgi:hypothetical protein